MKSHFARFTLIALLLPSLLLPARAGTFGQLRAAFAAPPASARPWVYWFWMDGNLSREGITADLEAMRRAGIGGVIIMEVDVGIPKGPVKFMSPEWRQLFKHVVREAEGLGLEITLNAGPGWTGSGGPWVPPEQSMQHLVASALEVVGPKRFDGPLPRPQRRPAFFGDGALPPALEQAKNAFYRDVAVLAFPTPANPQGLAEIDEKALYVRAPYSSQPGVKPYLPAPADFPTLPPGAAVDSSCVLDVSECLDAEGRLSWDVPEGRWTLLRFGRTSTGANTRPAPAPGLGLECDKLDPAALDAHYDAFVGALLREIGPRQRNGKAGWTMLHIDSWEMGAQNWSPVLRPEFQRRRGYDLLRYLPTFAGRVVDRLEVSERFLWDLRQTVQELIVENHAAHLKALGHRDGFGLSIEPYDMTPCADLTLGGVADVPMCEFWLYGFNTTHSVIEATSIAHTVGRPVVAAEAFTSTDAERWQAYPGAMKALGDWAFSAGVNRLVFHRYQHQPWLDRRPGMTMGPYGVHWERTQTWWDLVPAYHAYLSRCQFLLRQGVPVADVCFLVAEGAPQVFRPPASATRGNPPDGLGYRFDGCAPETLLAQATVKSGRLVLNPARREDAATPERRTGATYRVLVLPERQTMTPTLLRRVKELVEAGATVVGPRPLKSPSLTGYPACDAEVRRLADLVWGDCDGRRIREHALGKGRVLWERVPDGDADAGQGRRDPWEQAHWIWYPEGQPAAQTPVGTRWFRRSFTLEPNRPLDAARLSVTADNAFELWLNGQEVGRGDNFHQAYTFNVSAQLKPGENRIAVRAENGGDAPNPAGLIGALQVCFRDGATLDVVTDSQWQVSATATPEKRVASDAGSDWKVALDLGPAEMAPWNRPKPSLELPEQYGDFAVVERVLRQMGVAPDFESEAPLRYLHRQDGQTDFYFVANPEDRPVTTKCTFRVSGKRPELWDAVTGEVRRLKEFASASGRTSIPLRFEPHQSWFVVFNEAAPRTPLGAANFATLDRALELTGPWEVSFDPKWGGPANATFANLEDWSKRPEDGIRYYSGLATYRKTFDAPSSVRGGSVFLDLGGVKNLARVRLNGRDLGVRWCAPWRVDVTRAVQSKDNRLEITVANLWPNRLIGDQGLPPEQRRTWTTWNPFKQDTPLLESGLLGPVNLMTRAPQ